MTKFVTHTNNIPFFGNEKLLEIASERSFAAMIFEVLSGEKPVTMQAKLFETILNISIDHGEDTPSAQEVIKMSKAGANISEAVAAGVNQINDIHGGAIEPAMELFYEIKKGNLNIRELVVGKLENGKRIPGFGHRIYTKDPRTEMIFKLARALNINEEYLEMGESIEKELYAQKQKPIPLNIDGAIAAILCSFRWPSRLGKAVFIIARTPGLCSHYLK